MRESKIRREGWIILIWLLGIVPIQAQSELKTSFDLAWGGEYNIFKSPESLRSGLNGDYWEVDSLIISDMMFDAGYDVGFTRQVKDKYLLNLESDLWYRHYLNNNELSQTRLDVGADYTRLLSRKVHLGGLYNFRWSDRVGTSVTGDLLMRSFKYLGNEGMIYLDYLPTEKTYMRFFADYNYKIYYDERTLDPLDHGNLEFNYSLNFEPAREHEVQLELSVLDRRYSQYHALDSAGHYDRTHPFRHFRYYEIAFDYNWRPIRGFRINPELGVKRRVDLFQDYYSYLSYGGGLRIRYMWNRYYISLYGDYKLMKYDVRNAFTTSPDDPTLVYGYFDYSILFKYELSDRWELSLSASSDNRSSNSDLDYVRTRRAYKNYEALVGVSYSLPVLN